MSSGLVVFLIILFLGVLGAFIYYIVVMLAAPKKIDALEEMVKQGKSGQAIRTAKQIIAKESRNADAHYLLAKAYLLDNKPELALMEYKAVNDISDFTGICREAVYRKEIGDLYERFGHDEEALKEYLLLVKMEPIVGDHFYRAGILFEKRNKSGQALKYYKKAVELDPRHSDAHLKLGMLLYKAKRAQDARNELQTALKLRPDNFKAYFYLGKLLQDGRNWTGALGAFERSQKDPEFKIRSIIERGNCYVAAKQYDKAVTELERAVKLIKDEASAESLYAHYVLGVCHERERKIDRAIDEWEFIYARKPGYRDVTEKLGQYSDLRSDDRMKDFLTAGKEHFERICTAVAGTLNLAVNNLQSDKDGNCTILATERGGAQWRNTRRQPQGLLFLRGTENVEEPVVRHFYETMRSNSLSRGMIFSSSQFSRSALQFVESRPIDLYGKEKLQEMLKKAEAGMPPGR